MTNTRFALATHCLALLASSAPERLSSKEMSVSTNSNPAHLRRVLGELRVAGLVASRPGVDGVWELSREPTQTTLADVWRAVNPGASLLNVHGANPGCPVGRSIAMTLADIDDRLHDAVLEELGAMKLGDICVEPSVA